MSERSVDDRDGGDEGALETLICDCLEQGKLVPEEVASAFYDQVRDQVCEGCTGEVAIEKCRLPEELENWRTSLLDGRVSDRRIEELEGGALPTAHETALWRLAWLEDALSGEDADQSCSINFVPFEDDQGRSGICLASVRGYSFCGVEIEFHGLFETYGEAYAFLELSHYTSRRPASELPEFAAIHDCPADEDVEETTCCPVCERINNCETGDACAHAIGFVRSGQLELLPGLFGPRAAAQRFKAEWQAYDAEATPSVRAKRVEELRVMKINRDLIEAQRATSFAEALGAQSPVQVVKITNERRDLYIPARGVLRLTWMADYFRAAPRS